MKLRIFLLTGDVRQGRYLSRDEQTVTIYDGKPRKIPFTMIRELEEVRPPFEACLSAD